MAHPLKRVLWYFTPAKTIVVEPVTPDFGVTEERPSVYISTLGHVLLGLVYSLCMFGYQGLLIYNWAERPATNEYISTPSTDFDAMRLRLHVYCTRAPNCSDITITQNYTTVPKCAHLPSWRRVYNAAETGRNDPLNARGVDVDLCFSDDPVFNTQTTRPLNIAGVTVDFEAISTGGLDPEGSYPWPPGRQPTLAPGTTPAPGWGWTPAPNSGGWTPSPGSWTPAPAARTSPWTAQGVVRIVDLTGLEDEVSHPTNTLSAPYAPANAPRGVDMRIVNMDAYQVKSLIVGQRVAQVEGQILNRTAYPVGIQYDGKHPSTRGSFIVAQTAYTDFARTYRSHWLSIVGVLGSCAMAAWVVFTIMLCIIPLWAMCFPGPAQVLLTKAAAKQDFDGVETQMLE